MIIGAHVLFYSEDPDADRTFFHDVLGFVPSMLAEAGLSLGFLRRRLHSIPWKMETSDNCFTADTGCLALCSI